MNHTYFPATARGVKDTGWLQSHFFFSFSDFQDPTRAAFGSLLAFNDDFVAAGKGFGLHPHGNMEIISVMLRGTMSHRDSLGYENVVHQDGVQIMSAGSGLRHEEHNVGDGPVNFLQIWIAPKLANITPRYQFRSFPKAERRNKLVTIVSSEEGPAHCWINQNAKLGLGLFDAGGSVRYSFNPVNKCLFVFVIRGSIEVGGQAVAERDAIGIWATDSVVISARTDCEFLVIETPINQK
ncbi:MAG: pirin family protein [Chitinophagaceae bacterium]|nr:MAG: pirin family protein [Chitinophagaceae bacterium]